MATQDDPVAAVDAALRVRAQSATPLSDSDMEELSDVVLADYTDAVMAVTREITRLGVVADTMTGEQLQAALMAALGRLRVPLAGKLTAVILAVLRHAARWAVTFPGVTVDVDDLAAVTDTVPSRLASLPDSVDVNVAHTVAMAEMEAALSDPDPDMVATLAYRALTVAKRDVVTAAAAAAGEGTMLAAELAGVRLLWVQERDACLECLALGGRIVQPRDTFPLVSFREKRPTVPVLYPPRHPYCRCHVRPWAGDDTGLPGALVREAQRSVVRGLSAHDSLREKLGAADRLLSGGGVMLPISVIERGIADVMRGQFTKRPR